MLKNISIVFTIIHLACLNSLFAQTDDNKVIYRQAFNEQLQMLKGQKPVDFKRAVFITENAYSEGKSDYQSFCKEITSTGNQLKSFIKQRGLEKYKTSGNYAVFTYMMDSNALNQYRPFTYDFDDFMGDKDWKKMFVTKLIQTRQGNCHSLPFYYKILCDEIGANASLALAPNHVYIKHIDETGQWTNVELTNGGFPRDQWIIQEMAISVEAIKCGSYMTPLSANESIALTMFDLASGYSYRYGNDSFVLEVANTALLYYPKCIPLLQTKATCIRDAIEAEKKKANPDMAQIKTNIALYKQINEGIDSLGYKEERKEHYEEWVKMVENEKAKRNNSEKK